MALLSEKERGGTNRKGQHELLQSKGYGPLSGDEYEEIHVVAQLPEAAGRYRIKVSAFSENGLSLSRSFKVRVLPATKSQCGMSGDPPSTNANALGKWKRPALVFVGCTGSGKTLLSRHVAKTYKGFVVFVKSTTREPRAHEANGVDYEFIDGESFHDLLTNEKLVDVKKSDFDNAYYGVNKEHLLRIVREDRGPIFTCHSVEEAGNLRGCLRQWNINTVCIYIYGSEVDRKRALIESGGGRKVRVAMRNGS